MAGQAVQTISESYKHSEIGVIPKEWDVDIIENLASITTGDKNTQDRVDGGAYPFFVRSAIVEHINSYSFDGEAVLTAGDGVGTGKIYHYIKGKFDFHQRVYKISDFCDRLNGYYFYLYFSNHFLFRIMQMTAKSSVDSIRREMIANMKIPVPLLKEQTAIAAVLSDIDELIERLEKLIAKKRAIKQGLMQELLTGKRRLPGFVGKWRKKSLGEIGSFKKGRGIRKDSLLTDGLPCIRYGEIYTYYNDYIKELVSYISVDTAKESQRIYKGDLLFAGSGETAEEIGKCVAYLGDKEAYAGGDIIILTPDGFDSKFLGYLMNQKSVVTQKSQLGQGDAVVHIYASALAGLSISVPPTKTEQTAIAGSLSYMDSEIKTLEQKQLKYQQIKQGMMQVLLAGKVRLV